MQGGGVLVHFSRVMQFIIMLIFNLGLVLGIIQKQIYEKALGKLVITKNPFIHFLYINFCFSQINTKTNPKGKSKK